jgi:hypothetical protein
MYNSVEAPIGAFAPAVLSKQPNILLVMADDTVYVWGFRTRIAL